MSLPLISFFISLIGIIALVWRQIVLVRTGQMVAPEHEHPFVPEVQKMKHLTFKGSKKLGYVFLFLVLRSFIKSSNFIKVKSILLINELKTRLSKNRADSLNEPLKEQEVSKYLKKISEYRDKIKEMKIKIKEEEGIE